MDEAGPPSGKIPKTNIPEYSVGDLSAAIKRTLEGAFGRIRVRGEITELKQYGSGHTYLSLKDEAGKIRAVIWKTTLPRLGLKPENGVEVIATGKISAYGERSEYQLTIDRLEYAGVGALLARIETLRLRLAAEGLFDAALKKKLPRLPANVGVVTSAGGAVLHDIITTIARRFPRPILLWPVPVQGEAAAARIAAAITGMDRLPADGIPRPDLLIVARGGGSLEDLMAFNDEAVLRAVSACRIPLISAVGHETDTTLIDFVSDCRAPTPTAAAELAVPARVEMLSDLAQKAARLIGALHRATQGGRSQLNAAATRLPDLPSMAGHARQRLDDRSQRLSLALPNLLAARTGALVAVERHIPDPHRLIATRRAAAELAGLRLLGALRAGVQRHRDDAARVLPRLQSAWPAMLAARTQALALAGRRLPDPTPGLRARAARLELAAARLDGASYERVLARGFALVRDASGRPITRAADIKSAQRLRLRFSDGEMGATADGRQAKLDL